MEENINKKDEFDLGKILLHDDKYYEEVINPIMYNYITDLDLFRRNAAIAIGNSEDPSYIPVLEKALKYDNLEIKKIVQWALDKLSFMEK